MQIGGILVAGLVKVLVVLGSIGAVYLFVLRPVLDTTEKITGGITTSIQDSLDHANEAFDQMNVTPGTQNRITSLIRNVPVRRASKLNDCINRNPGDLAHLRRCAKRLSNQE